ncbi:MAG: hypothetical protein H0T46_32580 [Deltaproteobacteria bacterium]|nr:hypothetical protein [Deltaproteobacteria bacterium]
MRKHHLALAAAVLFVPLIGCDNEYDPDAPAIDPTAPRVRITSPARGTFAGDVTSVAVKGIATDDSGVVASVTVNGLPAAVEADGTFQVTVPVEAGTNLLHAIAKDAQNNTGKETRAVVAGALEPIKSIVPQAITASMTAQTFDALGRGVTGFLTGSNLTTLATPFNPMVDWGTTNSQPDCLYAQAKVTKVAVGPNSKVSFAPQPGGIWLKVELDRPRIDSHLQWAVSCFDGSRDVAIGATKITISGMMTVGIKASGVWDVHFDNPNVAITGFNVELGGVPDQIIDALNLDRALGPVLGFVAERFAVPYVNQALMGLNETKTVDVLGKKIDIKITPRTIDFDVVGATIELDSVLRAQGDTASPGFVYVTNDPPVMDMSQGFQLAVVDNAANQLLGSMWAAKGLEYGLDLKNGSYGEVGTLYDRVDLKAAVPPFIDAHHGALRLTIGDLIGTFKHGPAIATMVAINAEVDLKVVAGAGGELRIDVGSPKMYVDVLDENVDGANQLSNAQFEAVSSFGLSRIVAFGSGALGTIPLPSFGGVAFKNVKITQQTGHLVVAGQVE